MIWIEEIAAVAEACGYKHIYFPDRGGVECVGLTKDGLHFPSHICEIVWEYLKQQGSAESWLTLWLGACDYARDKRESDGTS